MTIAAKTRYGKSLIPVTIGSLWKGVTIVEVPLLVLGTDKEAKASRGMARR